MFRRSWSRPCAEKTRDTLPQIWADFVRCASPLASQSGQIGADATQPQKCDQTDWAQRAVWTGRVFDPENTQSEKRVGGWFIRSVLLRHWRISFFLGFSQSRYKDYHVSKIFRFHFVGVQIRNNQEQTWVIWHIFQKRRNGCLVEWNIWLRWNKRDDKIYKQCWFHGKFISKVFQVCKDKPWFQPCSFWASDGIWAIFLDSLNLWPLEKLPW